MQPGRGGVFTLAENQIHFRYSNGERGDINNLLTTAPSAGSWQAVTNSTAEIENPVIDELVFDYLVFEPQELKVNAFGLIFPTKVTAQIGTKVQEIDLSEKVNGSKS